MGSLLRRQTTEACFQWAFVSHQHPLTAIAFVPQLVRKYLVPIASKTSTAPYSSPSFPHCPLGCSCSRAPAIWACQPSPATGSPNHRSGCCLHVVSRTHVDHDQLGPDCPSEGKEGHAIESVIDCVWTRVHSKRWEAPSVSCLDMHSMPCLPIFWLAVWGERYRGRLILGWKTAPR